MWPPVYTSQQGLEFALTNDDTAPQCVLRLTNALEDNVVAFKVKTTKPKRYLVKPNQGLVQPSESEPISIQLLAPEKKVILSDYAASGAWDDSNKFLVQSVVLSSDFLEQYDAASAKDQTQLLTDLWGDQSKIKKEVRQKKLTVSFKSDNATLEKVRTGPAFTLSKAVENAKDTLAHARSSTGSSTGHHSSKHGSSNDEQLWEEQSVRGVLKHVLRWSLALLHCKHQVKVLRAKYNDLVAFTVNLTAEKDLIQRSLDTTKEDLQREIGTRRHLEQQCKH
eukprot:17166-Heterococcus_DN1.PRE.1